MDRLSSFQRGQLNASQTTITTSPSRSQSWTLDALGNWTQVGQTGGPGPTSESRTHNAQNQITSAGFSHSANGEMTQARFTRPDSGATVDQDYRYDAWGRLVGVDVNGDGDFADASDQIHEYDAMNRRVQTITNNLSTDFYHSAGWQVLEERSRASGSAESSGVVKARNVWSPKGSGGYVDSLVLRDADLNNDGDVTDANERH